MANSLRGGRNKYSASVLLGGYVENRYNPSTDASGATLQSSEWSTTTASAQAEMVEAARVLTGVTPTTTGGDAHIDYANIVNYDRRRGAGSWSSLSKYAASGPAEYAGSFPLRPAAKLSQSALEEYRAQWTTDPASLAARRFETTNTVGNAKAVGTRFATPLIRSFAGAPKALEQLARTVAGTRAVELLRPILAALDESGQGRTTLGDLGYALSDIKVMLSPPVLAVVFNFFDHSSVGSISTEEFLAALEPVSK
jgi:hypothetical protein